MGRRSAHHRHHKSSKVSRGGLVALSFVFVLVLGAAIWIAIDTFKGSGSSDDVQLKKTPVTSTTVVTTQSVAEKTTTAQTTEATTSETQQTEPQQIKPVPAAVKLSSESVVSDDGKLVLKWEPAENAEGYIVSRMNDGVWVEIATITEAANTTYDDAAVEDGKTYTYKITSFAKDAQGNIIKGTDSDAVEAIYSIGCDKVNLYLLKKGTQCFDDSLKLNYTLPADGYYTGMPDEENKKYIRIDFMFETRLVKASAAKKVKGAVALPTSVIGQEGGEIVGVSACGPTAAAVIVRYDKGDTWNKDDLIRYTEKHKLADQGSMMGKVGEGGMSAPMVIKLIKMYSNGEYTAKNVYSEKEKPSVTLKKLIDSGKHSILSVRYAWGIVHHPYSIVHFVEPSAYSVEGGKTYFYYGDTSYGNGPRGLVKVEASEIDQSVAMVDSEPKCIIVLN